MEMLKLDDVYKAYDKHIAVNGVSFAVDKGSIFGLLGPNGAGKTSLIRMITTITKADRGQIFLNGEELNQHHPSMIGYLPEERGLYKKMKVGPHLMYLGQLKGLSESEAKNRIDDWLGKFNITDWYEKKIEELSKGMQQKIQFISTVLHDPELIILDEPFSGLDPINTNLIKDEIYNLKEAGKTILFSTHRMEQVEEICEDIVLINSGKKILEGEVLSIKNTYKDNKFVYRFSEMPTDEVLGSLDIIRRDGRDVEVQLGGIEEANDLLKSWLNQGVLIDSYKEIFPSLNEIFIKLVSAA